jgi:hypothetical protein
MYSVEQIFVWREAFSPNLISEDGVPMSVCVCGAIPAADITAGVFPLPFCTSLLYFCAKVTHLLFLTSLLNGLTMLI